MKAITYFEYGPPEVLELRDVPTPVPRDEEVLIRVRAVEATKSDCEMRSFRFAVKWFWLPLRLALGVRRPRRKVLGAYFAGEIEQVGADVTEFSEGDAVYGSAGLRLGAYGEYVALPARYALVAKPRNMSFEEAAAVPLGGLNALHFVRLCEVGAGDAVLVNGAGGSIGAYAVQIARSLGAEVTGVDSGIKEEGVRRFGAEHFVDYTRERFVDRGVSYDAVIDMVPGGSFSDCIASLKPGGRYVSGNPRLSVMLRSSLTSRFTDKTARFRFAAETRKDLRALTGMIEDGRIGSIVDRIYPMDAAPESHRRVETEQRVGAVVLTIAPGGN